MSDNTADLLIKIRTALEAGGIDAAKAKMEELTGATAQGSAASAEAARATAKHHAEMDKAARTLQTVTAAADGNIGAVIKLSAETNTLSGRLAKIIPVVGAFWAGWEGGKKIGDWFWGKFVGSVKDVGESAIKTKAQFKELDEVKLDNLLKALEKIEQSLQRSLADLNSVEARTRAEAAAIASRDIAKVESSTKPEDQKQREIADIKINAAKEEFDLVDEISNKREGTLRAAKEATDAEIAKAKEAIRSTEKGLESARDNYRSNPKSETLMKSLKQARNEAAAARETYGPKLPGLENQSAALGRQIEDEVNLQKRAGFGLETAGFQNTSAYSAAARTQQDLAIKQADEAERKAKEQADLDRKSRSEIERDRMAQLEEDTSVDELALGDAQLKDLQFRSLRQSKGTPKSKYSSRSFSSPKAQAEQAMSDAEKENAALINVLIAHIRRQKEDMAALKAQVKNEGRGS